jgi:hypothetical protein
MVPLALSEHHDYYYNFFWNLSYRGGWRRRGWVSNPREWKCYHSPPQCPTFLRAGGNAPLSDELDCLSLTSHFTGISPALIMETSSLPSTPRSDQALTLLTKALTKNPRKATESYSVFPNFPQTNGTLQLHLNLFSCQSTMPFIFSRILKLTLLSYSIRVADSELGIKVAPFAVFSPRVSLILCARA